MHWADKLADEVIHRASILKKDKMASIRAAATPSGGKHIGNLNDQMRAFFVYKSIVEKGFKARFVNTHDDRDPMKDVPKKLCDLNGVWHDSSKFPLLKQHLGKPLCLVPDAFGCCDSYAQHFSKIWDNGLHALGLKPETHFQDDLYKAGKFEPFIQKVFEKRVEAGKLVAKFQASKSDDYIPFDAICPNCQRLAPIDDFNLKNKTVSFTCGGKAIKKKKTEGCGYSGEVPWVQGKLQWRFEWPANWALFETDFEPFGKDHFEGSWKSGLEIARAIYEIKEPIPFVYEFFLVNGAKMSASVGNVYIVQDVLKFLEPDVLRFYYVKRPEKQRDLDLSKIFQLVDEFDEAEKVFFGKAREEEIRSDNREENAKRMYELSVMGKHDYFRRVSYSFAGSLSQLLPEDKALQKLAELKHIDLGNELEVKNAKLRLKLASHWIDNFAGEDMKLSLLDMHKSIEARGKLQDSEKNALSELAEVLKKGDDDASLIESFKLISQKHELELKRFFEISYLVLIGKSRGPKLTLLLQTLERQSVLERLKGSV